MVVSRIFVICFACCLSLMAQSLVRAQIFNPSSQKEVRSVENATTEAESSKVKQASWYTLPMPKITMPKIEIPKFSMPSFMASGDAETGAKPSIFAPISEGAKKVSDGSKKAWEGAKEMFNFSAEESEGGTTSKTTGSKEGKPSFWERMFTPKEPEGPKTVAEFMAQPRLDP